MVYKDCWELNMTSLHYKHVCCNGTMLGFTAKIVRHLWLVQITKSHCGTNKNVKEKRLSDTKPKYSKK